MNPPFTRKERLTNGMKGIGLSILGEQNYWAYFLPLADSFLHKNGKIAAVLPRDLFRGEYSKAVREYLFTDGRYSLRYVVKSLKDWAFSEKALFRDYLVVFQKGKTQKKCAFIYLKKKINDIGTREATGIPITVKQLQIGENFENEEVFVIWKDQQEIVDNWRDLGHMVAFNTHSGEYLEKIYHNAISKSGKKLVALKNYKPPIMILRGLEPNVENLLNLVFVVRPLHKNRAGHSALTLIAEDKTKITGRIKGWRINFEIPPIATKRGLKTASYVPRLNVDKISDVAILRSFDGIDDIQRDLGMAEVDFKDVARKAKSRFSRLLVSRRFDFTSPGTKALAFYSPNKLLPGKAFWNFKTDINTSKALCLWFNSTFSFMESLLLQTETRGSFIEITKEKLREFHVPNLTQFDINILLEAFERVQYIDLPPLYQQFDNPPEARRIIDHAVLKTIGYSDDEINKLLPGLYQAMAVEMQSWRELMHKSSAKEKEKRPQLSLLPEENLSVEEN